MHLILQLLRERVHAARLPRARRPVEQQAALPLFLKLKDKLFQQLHGAILPDELAGRLRRVLDGPGERISFNGCAVY